MSLGPIGDSGSTFALTGSGFETSKAENIVKVGETLAVVETGTESRLDVRLPRLYMPLAGMITVEPHRGLATSPKSYFTLPSPYRLQT